MSKIMDDFYKIKKISVTYKNSKYYVVGILSNGKKALFKDSIFASVASRYARDISDDLNILCVIPDTIKFIANIERSWIDKSISNCSSDSQLEIFTKMKELI